jgi:hypothetical protein
VTKHRVILVSGALANKPWNGGEAWVRLSWALGLRRLGNRVYLVEQIAPGTCVDREGNATSFEASENLAFFRHVVRAFDLAECASLICGDGEAFEGLPREALLSAADDADLLVNISGHLDWPPLFDRVRCKAYIDIDPGFTQFWHQQGTAGARLDGHDFYFTIAENIGRDDCTIPTCGINWLPIRQPVVLEDWPVCPADSFGTTAPIRFTTVASWRGSFGTVTAGGRTFGLKVHEFRKVLPLPGRVPSCTFEIALAIHADDQRDLDSLRASGWRIENPRSVAADPDAFRRYVQESAAEFSVAQGIYVETRSGWVSDRTVRYLASGRPVLVQDTGLTSNYPCGSGLVTFSDLDGAAEAAERIGRDYVAHARAARALAERYFESGRVLTGLLKRVGLSRERVMA